MKTYKFQAITNVTVDEEAGMSILKIAFGEGEKVVSVYTVTPALVTQEIFAVVCKDRVLPPDVPADSQEPETTSPCDCTCVPFAESHPETTSTSCDSACVPFAESHPKSESSNEKNRRGECKSPDYRCCQFGVPNGSKTLHSTDFLFFALGYMTSQGLSDASFSNEPHVAFSLETTVGRELKESGVDQITVSMDYVKKELHHRGFKFV